MLQKEVEVNNWKKEIGISDRASPVSIEESRLRGCRRVVQTQFTTLVLPWAKIAPELVLVWVPALLDFLHSLELPALVG